MPNNPLASYMAREEAYHAKQIEKTVNKALAAKELQKKLDSVTNQSSKKPPRPVMALYEQALVKQEKLIAKSYPGMIVTLTPSFKMEGPSWRASIKATVRYHLTKCGGGTHKVVPGDTLWDISRLYYGEGYYWTEIAKANPKQTDSKGNFILSGTVLRIPALDIVVGKACQPAAIQKTKSAPKPATKPARPVALPIVELDLQKAAKVQTVARPPGMTVIYTLTLKGKLKAQIPGTVTGKFTLRGYETEISNGAKPFATSFTIKHNAIDSISVKNSITGTTWTSKISITKTGSAKFEMASKPVQFKHKGIIYKGEVGLSMEIQAIPDPKAYAPAPVPMSDAIGNWFRDNARTLAGIGLLIGAGTIIVVTIGEDIVTLGAGIADDPISFAAAGMMARQALVMIR